MVFLSDSALGEPYTNPKRGFSVAVPAQDRVSHANWLSARLEDAWNQASGLSAVAHSSRDGIYLEFESFPDIGLNIDNLDFRKSNIRLVNVREVENAGHNAYFATVYVPKSKSGFFTKKLDDYRETNTVYKGAKTENPRNARLINSIRDIRVALIRSFWTDSPSKFPTDQPAWVEIWIRRDSDGASFSAILQALDLIEHPSKPVLHFPERSVFLVWANEADLTKLLDHSDQLAEIRLASEPSSFFIELANSDQVDWVQDLLARCDYSDPHGVVVCLLDSGLTVGHPLISPATSTKDALTVEEAWGTGDTGRHGTLMAGLAIYGDLHSALVAGRPVEVVHRIESVKILPPSSTEATPKHLWGYITAQGVYRAEINAPERRRVFCMAITATETRDRGKPTSWSAEADQLAAGVLDSQRRLIIVSGGNIEEPEEWNLYPASNKTNEIHDPGQAWNVLTIGAYTSKIAITDSTYAGYVPIAASGCLSPFSTTSLNWAANQPIKPEVLFEGGNAAKAADGVIIDPDELQLVSTYHDPGVAHFARFNATSAASAQAAEFAASILSRYPNIWPETLRGLIVHSAEWTQSMLDAFKHGAGKTAYRDLLRTCGYGVADLDRAIRCLNSRLTMVCEGELRPFKKKAGGGYGSNEIKFYELPWPKEALEQLGHARVTMRVTLSYFIEPSPGEVGWNRPSGYASHGLRFDLNNPNETKPEFVIRKNKEARSEEDQPGSASASQFWMLGQQLRDVGSIHSDEWSGSAADLASSNFIAVYPTIGWWRERPHLNQWDKPARYSLIVSIQTPPTELDIYAEVQNLISVQVPIET